MQYRIQQAIHMTEYGMKTKHMEPFFEECKEEHLLTISLPGRQMTDKEMMTYISEHLEYCHQNHLTEELPIGSIVYKNQYLKGSYNENCYYVRIEKKRKDDNYWLKPKGYMAQFFMKDSMILYMNLFVNYWILLRKRVIK